MPNKLRLDVERLAVDSFPTTHTPAEPVVGQGNAGDAIVTCLQTACGRYACCA